MSNITEKARKDFLALAEKRIDSKVAMLGAKHQDSIAFTVSQLEELESTIFDVLFTNPMDAFRFVPMRAPVAAGSEVYSYRMAEKFGNAKVIEDAATDRPLVGADLTKTNLNVIRFGAAYDYEVADGERNAILDFDFVQFKARACAEAIARAHNEFALVGGAGVDGGNAALTGFYNDANLNNIDAGDEDWATITPADMYAFVSTLVNEVSDNTGGVMEANTCLLPLAVYNRVNSTRLADGTAETVMEALRKNHPGVAFELAISASGRGAGGSDRVLAYHRSPAVVEYIHSVMYDEAAPDKKGFHYTVEARGKAFGTVWRYPIASAWDDVTNA